MSLLPPGYKLDLDKMETDSRHFPIYGILPYLSGKKSSNLTYMPNNDVHAVVEFASHQCAMTALARINAGQHGSAGMTIDWANDSDIHKLPQAIIIKVSAETKKRKNYFALKRPIRKILKKPSLTTKNLGDADNSKGNDTEVS